MRKQHILYIVAIIFILNLVFIENNTYSLSYESSVGIGFTFNPTLSVSLSSNDLTIFNLTPDSSGNSNSINVSVATNAAYGYTLSATVGDNTHNNSNLTHSNNIDTFSSIATNANLSSLEDSEDNNIWGYSTSLDNGTTWSNYNGLSSSSSTTLLSPTSNISSSVDFKIGAKASSTQASGIYTNTINFIAISKVAPMSLLDSFIASGETQLNGYFKMQDMTHDICNNVDIEESELQLIDVRDNKIYWVAKLKDGNCWMTQNLDLDLSHEVALTSETSDIDPESYGKTIYTAETGYTKDETTGIVSWLPSTIDENGIQKADTIEMVWNNNNTSATVPGWANDNYKPYSANAGDRYKYTSSSTYNEITYTSLQNCADNNNNDIPGCQHAHFGDYYNWPAAVASNYADITSGYIANSICPKRWRLPIYDNNNEFGAMLKAQNVWSGSDNIYADNGFNILRISPLYFARFGNIGNSGDKLGNFNVFGRYWFSTIKNLAHSLLFNGSKIWPVYGESRYYGFSVRCLAK